ncbi:hypothetical protein B4U79_15295 [Dinothrombium tinctorium]|uniref:Uncharacterized protein n=1 Tax=Dinothrombium tinctorium TaxID=1965070 RepID=A0A3S3NCT7_9ACAR|nr:hypothetical protein B4U79_15295 [Dinothrombium tinctorium]
MAILSAVNYIFTNVKYVKCLECL